MYKNVIVIDDDEIDIFITSTFIKNTGLGERISTFDSAAEALAFLRKEKKDLEKDQGLIFLDINMPEMNGFDFLESFSEFPSSIKKAFKIILLTSSIHMKDVIMAKENSLVYKFIHKPLTGHLLMSLKADI
jgi:two-component SAPR family response regulator